MLTRKNLVIALIVAALAAAFFMLRDSDAPSGGGPSGMGPSGMGQGGAGGPPGMGQGGRPGGPPGMGGPPGGMPALIVTRAVAETDLTRELKALGTAKANEAIEVTSKISNIVTAIRFADGQLVRAGDVIVELDGAQARADLAAADAALTESKAQLKRAQELLPTQALSQSQFDQIVATQSANAARVDAARARLADTVIRAPFSGRVGLRRVSVGTLVSPGTVITTLDDSSLIKVDFGVPEVNLPALRVGLELAAESAAYPGRRFVGKVTSIDSRIDPVSRSVQVRAEIPNREGLLKPGMFLNVDLLRDARRAIVIPEEALVPEQNRQYVFVVKDGMAEKREVRIGSRRPGNVEIVEGLAVGERIVVEGTVKLREGGPVRDLAHDVQPARATGERPAGGKPQ